MSVSSIDGINSGLNTTEIIDTLMEVERGPAYLMEQQKAENTNIISSLQAFQAKLLALSAQTRQLSRKATFDATDVQVSDDSYLTASASGRVGSGSYDIQVLQLARNHQLASQGVDDQSVALFGTGTISINVGDGSVEDITIDSSNNSLVGIRQAINNAKAGVTASIVNDGSDSNAYRLVLTAENTGASNTISVDVNLSGTESLNFSTASFDSPETITKAAGSDAAISLGATAAYSGNQNKNYSFTVQGTGAQTVGTDNIVVDWTDGTNSGSIIVTQADTEVELVGEGADGLKLNLSGGTLTAGDTFQVTAFSPLLQSAADAKIALGADTGGGSPITVTSSSNTFKQVMSGLTLTVKDETEPGQSIRLSTATDTAALKTTIQSFLTAYNDALTYIDDQNSYNTDTGEGGVLLGDYTLQLMQNQLRSAAGSRITGIESQYNQLATIGIRTNTSGELVIVDAERLEEALQVNLDDVINLFTDSGASSRNGISFVASSAATKVGEEFAVNITQVATSGSLRGSGITSPASSTLTLNSSNNRLRLNIDGVLSNDIVLSQKTYNSTDELIQELQNKIDSDEKIGQRGVTVEWIETGADSGYIELRSSTYGSGSRVGTVTSIENSAYASLGLISAVSEGGKDVAGTINGEKAEGKGQLLKGAEGNATTEGLQLRIDLQSEDLIDGSEGTVTVAKGVAAKLTNSIESLTQAGSGMLDARIKGVQAQIDNLTDRITEFDERLALRRESLELKYYAMEQALGHFSSLGTYLQTQFDGININWKQ